MFRASSKARALAAAVVLPTSLFIAWSGPAFADASADALSVMNRLQGQVSEAETICAKLTRRASAAGPATRTRLLEEIAATKGFLAQAKQSIADIRRFLNARP